MEDRTTAIGDILLPERSRCRRNRSIADFLGSPSPVASGTSCNGSGKGGGNSSGGTGVFFPHCDPLAATAGGGGGGGENEQFTPQRERSGVEAKARGAWNQGSAPSAAFFGVYDGHDGDVVAETLHKNLHTHVAKQVLDC